jgi:hypothetical protein
LNFQILTPSTAPAIASANTRPPGSSARRHNAAKLEFFFLSAPPARPNQHWGIVLARVSTTFSSDSCNGRTLQGRRFERIVDAFSVAILLVSLDW